MNKELAIWDDPKVVKEVKNIYGKDLTDTEWLVFFGIGKSTGLNPFLREIWAIKYGNAPATIFVGRDGYRKSAQAHKDYDYHLSDAVYSNDTFEVDTGKVKHKYDLTGRGELKGAYCIVKRKGSSSPSFVFVELKEYYQGNINEDGTVKVRKFKDRDGSWKESKAKPTLWDQKPATMIKKVAEAQALRGAFQELFAGTYSEDELPTAEPAQVEVIEETPKEEMKKDFGLPY